MFLVSLLVANPGKSVLRINFRCYVNWSSVRGSALSLKMDFLFAQFPCKWLMMNDEALRFATDPNLGGTEKLTIAKPCSGMMGDVPKIKVTDVVSDPAFRHVIPPLSIAFVKGWTRGMASHCNYGLCLWGQSVFGGQNMFSNCAVTFSILYHLLCRLWILVSKRLDLKVAWCPVTGWWWKGSPYLSGHLAWSMQLSSQWMSATSMQLQSL